jgi:hypothetical protein
MRERMLRTGRPHKAHKLSPAIAAGLTDKLWDVADIVRITDEYKPLSRLSGRRLIRPERHSSRSYEAALTFEIVERDVGAGWMRFDDSDSYWFAAYWTGLTTDWKPHGMSFRPTRFQANREQGTTQMWSRRVQEFKLRHYPFRMEPIIGRAHIHYAALGGGIQCPPESPGPPAPGEEAPWGRT